MMGLAERFLEHGHVVRHIRWYSKGKFLVSLDFAHSGSRFGMFLDLPQDETERLLRARIAELGGVVEDGTELTGLTAGPGAVIAAVRDRGGRGVITAGYVVGCDGAHSRVRRELGLTFHGHPYPQDWLLADVLLDWDLREDAAHAFFRPDGLPAVLFPMRGHRWRLTLPLRRQPERPGAHPDGDPAADRPADAAAGHRVRPHLAGQLPLPSPVRQRLPARPRAAGRRRGAHPYPGRRPGHEHRDHGRAQPGLEARPGRRRPGARRAARQLRHRTAPGSPGRAQAHPYPGPLRHREPSRQAPGPRRRRPRPRPQPADPAPGRQQDQPRLHRLPAGTPGPPRAGPAAAGVCPTFRSGRTASSPRCTASCAAAATSCSFPALTRPACWPTPRCGPTTGTSISSQPTPRKRRDLVTMALGRSSWSGRTATWRPGEGPAAWSR